MISLISIGISEYNNEDSIPCAVKDSELIYKTFETSFECEFESFNSCCFSNLSSDEFHTLLNVERTTMSNTKNILIIYFSGHAHIENDKLKLLFSDYDGKHRGAYLRPSRSDKQTKYKKIHHLPHSQAQQGRRRCDRGGT